MASVVVAFVESPFTREIPVDQHKAVRRRGCRLMRVAFAQYEGRSSTRHIEMPRKKWENFCELFLRQGQLSFLYSIVPQIKAGSIGNVMAAWGMSGGNRRRTRRTEEAQGHKRV